MSNLLRCLAGQPEGQRNSGDQRIKSSRAPGRKGSQANRHAYDPRGRYHGGGGPSVARTYRVRCGESQGRYDESKAQTRRRQMGGHLGVCNRRVPSAHEPESQRHEDKARNRGYPVVETTASHSPQHGPYGNRRSQPNQHQSAVDRSETQYRVCHQRYRHHSDDQCAANQKMREIRSPKRPGPEHRPGKQGFPCGFLPYQEQNEGGYRRGQVNRHENVRRVHAGESQG